MKYRIIRMATDAGWWQVAVQVRRFLGWITVWKRETISEELDYALQCAEEIKEHLEEDL